MRGARDAWNLRHHTYAPNSAFQELIDLHKEMYPNAFAKPGRWRNEKQ